MQFAYTLTGTIEVPDGSRLTDTGTGIILPDGRTLKLWEAVEVSTVDGEDHVDLTTRECELIGVHYDGDMCRFEET